MKAYYWRATIIYVKKLDLGSDYALIPARSQTPDKHGIGTSDYDHVTP
jgi:hypothetical protein